MTLGEEYYGGHSWYYLWGTVEMWPGVLEGRASPAWLAAFAKHIQNGYLYVYIYESHRRPTWPVTCTVQNNVQPQRLWYNDIKA